MKMFELTTIGFFRIVVVAGLFSLVWGCVDFGDNDDDDDDTIDATEMIASENGDFLGRFTAIPEAPIVGDNTLTFLLADAQEKPIEGAAVTVTPFMPSMGHGSTETPVVEEATDGNYTATSIVYTMQGEWRLTIEVDTGETKDSFIIFYQAE